MTLASISRSFVLSQQTDDPVHREEVKIIMKETDQPYNYELTAQPKLCENTYWGGFRFREDFNRESIKNRDVLMEQLCIARLAKQTIVGEKYVYATSPYKDHCETYRTRSGGFLFIVSPYGAPIPAPLKKATSPFRWEEVPSIYNIQTRTFFLEFESAIAVRRSIMCRAARVAVEYAEQERGGLYNDYRRIAEYHNLIRTN